MSIRVILLLRSDRKTTHDTTTNFQQAVPSNRNGIISSIIYQVEVPRKHSVEIRYIATNTRRKGTVKSVSTVVVLSFVGHVECGQLLELSEGEARAKYTGEKR
jgi:hypothetical protein